MEDSSESFENVLFFCEMFWQKTKEKSGYEKKRKHMEVDERQDAVEEGPRQCFGPGCIEAARVGSKYCSDDCGMKLAKRCVVIPWYRGRGQAVFWSGVYRGGKGGVQILLGRVWDETGQKVRCYTVIQG